MLGGVRPISGPPVPVLLVDPMSSHAALLRSFPLLVALLFGALGLAAPVQAQDDGDKPAYTVRTTPAELHLEIGQTAELGVEIVDASGEVVDVEYSIYSRNRRALTVSDEGIVQAVKPGTHQVVIRAATKPRRTSRLPFARSSTWARRS